jgi:hypothetical protein
MPTAAIQIPGQSGLISDRKAELQSVGLTSALNVWFDQELGSWTPRPTWRLRNSSTGPILSALRTGYVIGGTGIAVSMEAGLGALSTPLVYTWDGSGRPTLRSVTPGGSPAYYLHEGHVFKPVKHNDTAFVLVGTNEVGAVGPSFGTVNNPSTIGPGFVNAGFSLRLDYLNIAIGSSTLPTLYSTPTCSPISAFGRVWAGFRSTFTTTEDGGVYYLGWTDASAIGFNGVGSGRLAVPASSTIRGVFVLSSRIVVVTENATFLYGAPGGGPPVDPNSAGQIVLLDTLQAAGTSFTDWAIPTEDAIYLLSSIGLLRLTTDSFSSQPEGSLVPDTSGFVKGFYRDVQQAILSNPNNSGGVPLRYPTCSVYWASEGLLLFSCYLLGRTLAVSVGNRGQAHRMSMWQGATPSSYATAGPELIGCFAYERIPASSTDPYVKYVGNRDIGRLAISGRMTSAGSSEATRALGATFDQLYRSEVVEDSYQASLMVGLVANPDLSMPLFPKQVLMGTRYFTPNPLFSQRWFITQQRNELDTTVASAVPNHVPLAGVSLSEKSLSRGTSTGYARNNSSFGPYSTTPNATAQLRGSSYGFSVGYRIEDARDVQFLVDSMSIRFETGEGFRAV